MATGMALWLVPLAALVGGVVGWLVRPMPMPAPAPEAPSPMREMVIKLGHDIRGALSPALLMAEQLEAHADPAVRQAAGLITRALDRSAELAKDLGRVARGEKASLGEKESLEEKS